MDFEYYYFVSLCAMETFYGVFGWKDICKFNITEFMNLLIHKYFLYFLS